MYQNKHKTTQWHPRTKTNALQQRLGLNTCANINAAPLAKYDKPSKATHNTITNHTCICTWQPNFLLKCPQVKECHRQHRRMKPKQSSTTQSFHRGRADMIQTQAFACPGNKNMCDCNIIYFLLNGKQQSYASTPIEVSTFSATVRKMTSAQPQERHKQDPHTARARNKPKKYHTKLISYESMSLTISEMHKQHWHSQDMLAQVNGSKQTHQANPNQLTIQRLAKHNHNTQTRKHKHEVSQCSARQ